MILRRIIEHVKAQNWTAVGLDFVIVVVGVFIGIQVSNWNDARIERTRETIYLERIAEELDGNIASIEHAIRRSNERMAFGELLLQSIDDRSVVEKDPARFVAAIAVGGSTFSPLIYGHAFEELKASGNLGILRDEKLRTELADFYTQVKGAEQWNYIRELNQSEYIKRSAGVLTYDQLAAIPSSGELDHMDRETALAVYDRMVTRPEFIEWLPNVVARQYDIETYEDFLNTAQDLRERVRHNGDAVTDKGRK